MRYYKLRFAFRELEKRRRVVENLKRLRAQLDADVPTKDSDHSLLLATWNIRDLGKLNRRGYGSREPETWFYIAEILSRFDFAAVQEINELDEWLEIMDILGPDFDFIATDVTDTALGGNGERLLYVYDKRKVRFRNIAGEIVLPNSMLISQATADIGGERLYAGKQFRRTPFTASFQAGWFRFDICTVHIYYGEDSGAALRERIEEIERIAKYFGRRAEEALKRGKALILLGDFNIVHPEHETMLKLKEAGFIIPKSLDRPSNLDLTKYYDQIAFQARSELITFIDRPSDDPLKRNAGIFEIYTSIFRNADEPDFRAAMLKSTNGRNKTEAELKEYYPDWKTYQISDHKPMWVRIGTNEAAAYLDSLVV
ncbi:endonuclease/exonuclease/phosphatase family protein [Ensifer sp. 4252]|uniref:endonuclease/exonuclease/phosphatase family protein n=1 Tax=Ensifer sp. 4252 TaxID=3373915 RepID=UPI003D2401B9